MTKKREVCRNRPPSFGCIILRCIVVQCQGKRRRRRNRRRRYHGAAVRKGAGKRGLYPLAHRGAAEDRGGAGLRTGQSHRRLHGDGGAALPGHPPFPGVHGGGAQGRAADGAAGTAGVVCTGGALSLLRGLHHEGGLLPLLYPEAAGGGAGDPDQRRRGREPQLRTGYADAPYRFHQYDGHESPDRAQR